MIFGMKARIWILACIGLLLGVEVRSRESYDFVVDPAGGGDFTTLQQAVDAMPDYGKGPRIDILVKNGTYREKLEIRRSKHNLRFVGESADGVIVTYGDYASKPSIVGIGIGTSGTATMFVHADGVTFEQMTFENSAGPVGQAVAVFVSGDRVVFRRCRFLGFQDTLYTMGPDGRQYYEDCYIEGTTDFIFGFATVVFNRCTLHSKANSYITAAATPQGREWGYLFVECDLTAAPGITKVYLGRPWREYARTVFVRCRMGAHILPEGWHNWNKPAAERNAFYAEWSNTGPGAALDNRVKWAHRLSDEEAAHYTVERALAGTDGWNPLTGNEEGPMRQR